jgi:hypothetical protein
MLSNGEDYKDRHGRIQKSELKLKGVKGEIRNTSLITFYHYSSKANTVKPLLNVSWKEWNPVINGNFYSPDDLQLLSTCIKRNLPSNRKNRSLAFSLQEGFSV